MPKSKNAREWKDLSARFSHLPSAASLIELKGELDQTVFAGLCDFADERLTGRESAVIIDMSEIDFMDSSGVKFINRLVRRFGRENIAVYQINEDINRVLSILGIEKEITYLSRPDELRRWRGENKNAA